MSIRIVTDSTCDLPQEIVHTYGINVVPLYINFGDQGYLDGIEISRQEFYQRLSESDPLPTTATPGVDVFCQTYQHLAEEGASAIISIHISVNLSATVEVARAAAQQTPTVPVTVFDSQQLSLGTGFLVLCAAKATAEGVPVNQIILLLEEQTSRTYVIAALDTLEFLKRSGRMNAVVASLGNILQVKPLIIMHAGEATGERVRTRERAIQRLIQFASELGPLEQLALVHTHASQEAQDLYYRAKHLFSNQEEPLSVDVTPVLGTHVGPGAVGLTCVAAKEAV